MNTDATEETFGSSPASIRRSIPRIYASAVARYCSRENSSVTFTGTPAKVASSIAGSPCSVPGILMNTFSRPARCMQVGRGAHAAGGVIGEQRRDLQRHPAVDPGCPLMDRREQVRRAPEVLNRQLEEQRLTVGRLAAFWRISSS